MCGISGIYCLDARAGIDGAMLERMTGLIKHRGPDDEGYLDIHRGEARHYRGNDSISEFDNLPSLPQKLAATLAFGFRRLSILDLSAAGHQPMSDNKHGLHIVFNGEIYNHVELREELKALGYEFVSGSDTEVILKAYHAWKDACLQRFNGIWAFALWDAEAGRLFCARDRFGVKPFYYKVIGKKLVFGSEIKQLVDADDQKDLNLPMLLRGMKINGMLAYGEETYFKNIKALRPGHFLSVNNGKIETKEYYTLDPETFESSKLSFEDAAQRYRELFLDAVRLQLRADIEVGSCLSGGLDSSAIVSAASSMTEKPLKTFSAWFGEVPALDERKWIKEVCRSAGCVSHLVSPSAAAAMADFSDAAFYNDLPLGAGFAAQHAVMKLAQAQGIKVLLDGQGSDELSGGYRHAQYRYFADLIRRGELKTLPSQLGSYLAGKNAADKVSSLIKIALSGIFSERKLYGYELKHLRFDPFVPHFTLKALKSSQGNIFTEIKDFAPGKLSSFLYNMIYTTSLQTLLHYEDRMSMAAGIESRVPFLDHRLVELVFSLPSSYKIKPPQGKLIHRAAMQSIVPEAIFKRTDKSIFGAPFHQLWMRNQLKDEIGSLFTDHVFRGRGIWNLPLINARWQSYLKGDNSQAEMLFNILSAEIWFRRMIDQTIK
ncbi:MAG: asparagine synthase (glutamine-hydrolyzing) [Candidatus Cloacimonadaceae bacterium]|nr:asparagine synthase (glutamine-hydrolyzing) [Candidatus Cloacimonadaceae bacterium]